jgi:hypothetical protein
LRQSHLPPTHSNFIKNDPSDGPSGHQVIRHAKGLQAFSKWTPLHNRCFEEGYGYGNSTTAKPWLGFRCLRDYPFVMDLGVAIWKRLHHHFDGPSKQCPPTTCTVLLYLGQFGGHINPHQDNSPRPAIDPKRNSQIFGSSVLVVSLFHPMSLFPLFQGKIFTVVDRTHVCIHLQSRWRWCIQTQCNHARC